MMNFTLDWTAFSILCLAAPLILLMKRMYFDNFPKPSLAYSRIHDLEIAANSIRTKFAFLPTRLYQAALFCFLLAFLDPHFNLNREKSISAKQTIIPTEGIAMYLVLDQSGSMAEKVLTRTSSGSRQYIPKIDLLKQVTSKFVEDRHNDLLGLISFARVPHILAPLTLDHQMLLGDLEDLQVVKNPQDDGTAIGYAIYKAVNLIAATRHYADEADHHSAPYKIKSAVVVVVTDGMQDPSGLDKGNRLRTMELDDAANYAKSQNVRLYVINIDPSFSTEQYAPHRRQMQRITELTGGHFYLADEGQDLKHIYARINELEKGEIPQQSAQNIVVRLYSLYPYLIALGLVCFLLACLLDALYFRAVP